MDELDEYECFGVPAHVWVQDDHVALAPAGAPARRRVEITRDAAMLGMEAIPSPALAEPPPAE